MDQMTAYERYLVRMSELHIKLAPHIKQEESLENIIKQCILEQHDMAFDLMKKEGYETYTDDAFLNVAKSLIERYNKEKKQEQV